MQLSQTVEKKDISAFRLEFLKMIEKSKAESEGYHKILIIKFLSELFYRKNYDINEYNKKGSRCDIAISENAVVKVIFELKSPQNKGEMIHLDYGDVKYERAAPDLFGTEQSADKILPCFFNVA